MVKKEVDSLGLGGRRPIEDEQLVRAVNSYKNAKAFLKMNSVVSAGAGVICSASLYNNISAELNFVPTVALCVLWGGVVFSVLMAVPTMNYVAEKNCLKRMQGHVKQNGGVAREEVNYMRERDFEKM